MQHTKWTVFNVALVIVNLAIVACGGAGAEVKDWWHDDNVRISDSRIGKTAGGTIDQGAITLYDNTTDKEWFEIGAYKHGWTIQTPHRVEFHTGHEVSVSAMRGKLPRFQVRDIKDREASVWMNGNSRIGTGNLPLTFAVGSFNGGSEELARFDTNGDLVVANDVVLNGESLEKRLQALESRL